ncbi:hypothetical protein ACFLZJ_00315 [Nanoarchaeota archaeon]
MENKTKLLILRTIHIFIAIIMILALIMVYYSLFTHYRGILLKYSIILLIIEGLTVIIWGECPFGPLHRKLKDKRSIWTFFLPKSIAPYAFYTLAFIGILGMYLLLLQGLNL